MTSRNQLPSVEVCLREWKTKNPKKKAANAQVPTMAMQLAPSCNQCGPIIVLSRIAVPKFNHLLGMLSNGYFRNEETIRSSISNPLHVFEQNLLTAAVIEFRGPAVGVTRDSLSGFQGDVIFQKIRDAGRPK
jgi:hypothetical protein